MRKVIASVALVTAVALGGLAVAAVNPVQLVSAKSSSPSAATPDPGAGSAGAARQGRGVGLLLDKALNGLVTKGTITKAQAAAVKQAIQTDVKAFRQNHKGGMHRKALRRGVVTVSAKTIDISREDLVTALKSGQSIAQVAQSKGVDPEKVVDAIVTAGNTRVDAAVKAGKLPAARGAKIKQRLPEVAKKIVNRVPTRVTAPAGGN